MFMFFTHRKVDDLFFRTKEKGEFLILNSIIFSLPIEITRINRKQLSRQQVLHVRQRDTFVSKDIDRVNWEFSLIHFWHVHFDFYWIVKCPCMDRLMFDWQVRFLGRYIRSIEKPVIVRQVFDREVDRWILKTNRLWNDDENVLFFFDLQK